LSHRFNFMVLVSTSLAFLVTYLYGYYHNFFPVTHQPYSGLGRLIPEVSRSHTDTRQSVGNLWTSDQPDAETSSWQHTTLTGDIHQCRRRKSNPQSQIASGLRRRGRWNRLLPRFVAHSLLPVADTLYIQACKWVGCTGTGFFPCLSVFPYQCIALMLHNHLHTVITGNKGSLNILVDFGGWPYGTRSC